MAKKKQKDLSPIVGGIIMAIIAVGYVLAYSVMFLIIITPIVLPPVFLICALVYWGKYRKYDLPNIRNQFRMTDNDVKLMGVIKGKLILAKRKVEEITGMIKSGRIRVNKDGTINRVQTGGYEYEGALNNAQETINSLSPKYDELLTQQQNMYKSARKRFYKYWEYSISTVVFVITFIIATGGHPFSAINTTKSIEEQKIEQKQEVAVDSGNKDIDSNLDTMGVAWVDSFIFMVLAFALTHIVCRIIFRVKYKKILDVSEKEQYDECLHYAQYVIDKEG